MAHRRADTRSEPGDGSPHPSRLPAVLDAIRHPTMRRWSDELLAAESGCWTVAQPEANEMLVDAIARTTPDVVVVDTVDFPACCLAALDALPPGHVVVIGPEPDPSYRRATLAQGAAAWVSREHVGEELVAAVHAALGSPNEAFPDDTTSPRPSHPSPAGASSLSSPTPTAAS